MRQPAERADRPRDLHTAAVTVPSQVQACQHKRDGQSRVRRFAPSCIATSLHSSFIMLPQVLPASLRQLDVSGNALTQLHGLQQLACLTWLDASSNALQVTSSHTQDILHKHKLVLSPQLPSLKD